MTAAERNRRKNRIHEANPRATPARDKAATKPRYPAEKPEKGLKLLPTYATDLVRGKVDINARWIDFERVTALEHVRDTIRHTFRKLTDALTRENIGWGVDEFPELGRGVRLKIDPREEKRERALAIAYEFDLKGYP